MQVRIDPAALGLTPPENKLPVAKEGSGAPRDVVSGVLRGVGVLVHHTVLGVAALFGGPVVGYRKEGCGGACKGACAGVAGVVALPCLGAYRGGTRVIRRRFNVGVLDALVPENGSTLRERPER